MFADRRRWLIGGGVAVLLALAIWMQSGAAPDSPATAPARARTARAAADEAATQPVPPLKLESLKALRGEPSGTERNPFRFQPKVAPPPQPVAAPVVEMSPAPVLPPVPTGPPPPPPIALKFIALVERANGVKWAVLSDGKVTMYGRDGDSIDGRYRIVKIGAESVEVTHLDGRGRQVIRLTGQ